jgi:hypothetical protein
MRSLHHFKIISLILILLFVSGCFAAFPAGKLKELEIFPPGPEAPINAHLNITWNHYLNGVHKPEADQSSADNVWKIAEKTFKESGYFEKISPFVAHPDIKIKAHIIFKAEFSEAGLLFGAATFGVIPTYAMHHYAMDAEVTNLKTGQSRSFHLEDSVSIYAQTILILIAPFYWPGTAQEEMLENMFKNLAIMMSEEGLLDPTQ